jgi:hypothetical protein
MGKNYFTRKNRTSTKCIAQELNTQLDNVNIFIKRVSAINMVNILTALYAKLTKNTTNTSS